MKKITLTYLAFQNFRRRRFRTAITAITVVVMIATLFGTQLYINGVTQGLQVGTNRLGADLIVVPAGSSQGEQQFLLSGQAQAFYMNSSVLQEVQKVPGVAEASPQIMLVTLSGVSCCASGNLQIIGIDPTTDFTIMPWLSSPLKSGLQQGQGIVGVDMYSNFGGLQPYFFGRTYDLVGTLQRTDLGLDDTFFVSIADAESLIQANLAGQLPNRLPITILPGQISDVTVKLAPGASIVTVSDLIQSRVPGVSVVTASTISLAMKQELNGLLQTAYVAAGAIWAVALIMIGAIFSMSVNERQREIGLFRALGSTSRFVFGLITLEGTIITVVGGIVGLGVGTFAMYFFNGAISKAMGLPFAWPGPAALVTLIVEALAISTAIGIGTSLYPAYKSSRMEPYSAMRQE